MRLLILASKFLFASLVLTAAFASAGQAQKIVDPSTVAPEFREAAEKRRAEQLKQIACAKAAADQKIAPRERPQFIVDCFDSPNAPPTDISASRPAAPDAAPANVTPANSAPANSLPVTPK